MTDTRDEFNSLFSLYVGIAIAITAIVFALVLFALLRYRRREGRAPCRRAEAVLLEAIAAVAIAAIVAVILTRTFKTEAKVDDTAPGSLEVKVTAFQWGWRFDYPGEEVSVIGNSVREPTLGVPANQRVSFALTSRDVIHAFWIPWERFKRDAFPEKLNRFDLVFDRPGTHEGVCAEFCGLRHAGMRFRVLVLGAGDFQRWLDVQRSRAR